MSSSPNRSLKSKLIGTAFASVALSVGIATAGTASAATTRHAGSTGHREGTAAAVGSAATIKPQIRLKPDGGSSEGTLQWSNIWSGYVADDETYTRVQGAWTVPTATCAAKENSTSVTWVGLDGWENGTVEQGGTGSQCENGKPNYYAWTEMYPQQPSVVNLPAQDVVSAGDEIFAYVQSNATGTQYTMWLTDETAGWQGGAQNVTALVNGKPAAHADAMAEWITEMGGGCGACTSSLTKFSTVNFTEALATGNGQAGVVSSFPYFPVQMDTGSTAPTTSMVGTERAAVSALNSGGYSFSITWKGH